MSNPKIAICLSGEPRHRHHAAKSIHNFIKGDTGEECTVDIFYHFWDNITKRQSQIIDDPIIETVNKHDIKKEFKPTIGVCESKDHLDEHIDKIIMVNKGLIFIVILYGLTNSSIRITKVSDLLRSF